MSAIIDTHTHLYDIPDAALALRLSLEAGVSDIIALGVDYSSNTRHLHLVGGACEVEPRMRPRIHLALGIHPSNITSEEVEKCFLFFREILTGGKYPIVAIGEVGLDFWYKWVRRDEAKKNEQRDVFQRHLDLAKEFDLPVVVHSRGTWRECLDMLVRTGIKKANFHWYSGPNDVLQGILDAGYVMSVSPALEYSEDSRRAAVYAPLERILVETDTPVMVSLPGGNRVPSIPKDVWRTFNALCELKKLDKAQVLQTVNTNARAFFNI